jgi:hypothetical protein
MAQEDEEPEVEELAGKKCDKILCANCGAVVKMIYYQNPQLARPLPRTSSRIPVFCSRNCTFEFYGAGDSSRSQRNSR